VDLPIMTNLGSLINEEADCDAQRQRGSERVHRMIHWDALKRNDLTLTATDWTLSYAQEDAANKSRSIIRKKSNSK